MRVHNFIIATGGVANDGATKMVQGGHDGTVTLSCALDFSATSYMGASGITMVVGDGTSTRTITFAMGDSPDNNLDTSSMSSVDDLRPRIVAAVNGTAGGAVNVTAVDPGSGTGVTLTHDSGGKITISFGGDSTSSTAAVKSGTTFLSVSPSAATSSEVEVAEAVSFATGSIAHASQIQTPTVGKITLRDKAGSPQSHGSFNVFMEANAIVNDGTNFIVSGSLSANSDPTTTDAKRVRGDAVIITSYQK